MNVIGVENERVYWVGIEGSPSVKLEIDSFSAVGKPSTQHIKVVDDRVIIRDVSLFAGQITPYRAVKWALFYSLRLGGYRINRIKRYLTFGLYRGDEGN